MKIYFLIGDNLLSLRLYQRIGRLVCCHETRQNHEEKNGVDKGIRNAETHHETVTVSDYFEISFDYD